MPMDFHSDIAQRTPGQYEVALTIRQAELVVNQHHFVMGCAEQVGQPMGLVSWAESDWIGLNLPKKLRASGAFITNLVVKELLEGAAEMHSMIDADAIATMVLTPVAMALETVARSRP
jgi:hypothetical protein